MFEAARQAVSAAREQSVRRVVRYLGARSVGAATSRLSQASAPMTLRELNQVADLVVDPSVFVERLVGPGRAMNEVDEVMADIARRMGATAFPHSRTSLAALYGVIRETRPDTILETGVSIGVSTAVILAALERNGCGHLHSVDIDADVGWVALSGDTSRWTLHVHPHVGGESAMRSLVDELGAVDLYYHDSGHSWLWQTFEYETVIPVVADTVLSDDVDASWAFAQHCRNNGIRPVALVETNKVFAGYRV